MGRWVRARPQVTLFFSQQAHWAEGPASGRVAIPSQAMMAAADVRLNSMHKASPGSALSAHARPTAEIPITAASSWSCPLEKLLVHTAMFW